MSASSTNAAAGEAGAGVESSANKRSTSDGGRGDNDGLIKSETIVKDRKRYYLDLKENQRGRFLRVINSLLYFFQLNKLN